MVLWQENQGKRNTAASTEKPNGTNGSFAFKEVSIDHVDTDSTGSESGAHY
jgi:hypothetical protein